ncbi:MAG TPA: methyltransferase domain-containing protein, partial [Kofleriaceae bacterium]|nr:methyltransferase domain-containing protein [Kofleriaceae bacterium]
MVSAGELRRAFAELVAAGQPRAVIDAFATVERERFLGDPPWLIGSLADPAVPYLATPDADLAHVYRDNVIALVPDKQLNNGLPSAHARWLAAAAIAPGDHVLHVGAGTGYYTAILAELCGPAGRVVGYELEAALAERAIAALATRPWASVRHGDGGTPDATYDAIYVCCGATHARDEWLAALRPGGRLVVPLT